jgi:hypothetical protein
VRGVTPVSCPSKSARVPTTGIVEIAVLPGKTPIQCQRGEGGWGVVGDLLRWPRDQLVTLHNLGISGEGRRVGVRMLRR